MLLAIPKRGYVQNKFNLIAPLTSIMFYSTTTDTYYIRPMFLKSLGAFSCIVLAQ